MMAEYPYTTVPTKLESFLTTIQRVGKPEHANRNWLKANGFKSSNDPSMLRVLESLGFLDAKRVPTDVWQEYRHRGKSRQVLAAQLRTSYAELFAQYENAQTCSAEDLSNFFSAHSELGEIAIGHMVKSFQTLCSLADFGATSENGAGSRENEKVVTSGVAPLAAPPQNIESPAPALHIDFQVHIAADAPPEQIDKIFESMAKHLYNKVVD